MQAHRLAGGKGVVIGKLACKYHPNAELIEDYHAGDMVCSVCAVVVGDRVIDVGNDWRTFSNDGESKDMCRVGQAENLLYEGIELCTSIQQSDKSGGSKIPNFRKSKAAKFLDSSFGYIKEISIKMNITQNVMENAMHLFKSIQEKHSLKRMDKEAAMAICLYMECRRMSVTRTLNEFSASTGITKKILGRVYKIVFRLLETKQQLKDHGRVPIEDLISRYCSNIGLSFDVAKKAKEVALKVESKNIARGSAPSTVASAVIFIAATRGGKKITHGEIQQVTGVTEGAIKQCLKLLLPQINEIYPKDN